jgi:hypothetical protein
MTMADAERPAPCAEHVPCSGTVIEIERLLQVLTGAGYDVWHGLKEAELGTDE